MVSEVELHSDAKLRVVFDDSSPPTPYGIEQRASLDPGVPVDAAPEKGSYWPYFLVVPPTVESTGILLVEPNNTEQSATTHGSTNPPLD